MAKSDIFEGGRGGELPMQGPSDLLEEVRATGKPPGRVDKMAASVLQLCYGLRLIGKTCDEGPLRTAILEAAARAEARARDSVYSPHRASVRRRGGQRQHHDERAVAEETRDGAADDTGDGQREGTPVDGTQD